jgi:hypothetical protein
MKEQAKIKMKNYEKKEKTGDSPLMHVYKM